MSDILSASRNELIELVYELIDKVGVLETENARLRELVKGRKDGDGEKSSSPPSWVKPNRKLIPADSKKKRGSAYHRQREVPHQRVFYSLETCPDCGGRLGKPSVSYTRQTIDLPITPYQVTEHVVTKHWCFKCQKRVSPQVDFSNHCVGQSRIGLNLAATICLLRNRLRLPVGLIQTYLKLVCHLQLSQGEIVEILHTAARAGLSRYQDLLSQLKQSPLVHADETGGRENGRNGYFWSFSNPNTHYLVYRHSRGSQVVEEVLGSGTESNQDEYAGIVVSDFYAAYNTYCGFHQRCWVHLLRDMHELKQQYPKHPPLNRWAKKVRLIYEEAKAYTGPPPDTPIGLAAQMRIIRQHNWETKLKQVCQPYLYRDTPMSTLCGRITTFLPELFTFVRFADTPSHNNFAERILRHTVVTRKISGGTQTAQGSLTQTVLTSLFDTWHLRNLDLFQQCRLLLATCQ